MTDDLILPPVNGTEQRLDALIARVDRLCDLLTPVALEPVIGVGTVELREPEAPVERPIEQSASKRRRR